jgi:putative ABC transport system permease protein
MFARLVLRSIWGRRGRMALAGVAVLVPAALVTGAANFLLDAQAKLRTEVRTSGPNLVVTGAVPPALLRSPYAERIDGVATVDTGLRRTEAAVIGVEPARAAAVWTWWRVTGRWPRAGECLLGRRLADRLRADRVTVGGREYAVSGTLETEGEEERAVILPLGDVTGRTRVEFVLAPEEVEPFAAELRRAGLSAEPVRALAAAEAAVTERLRGLFGFVALFVLVLAGVGIAATFLAMVQEQRREIGVLSALGGGRLAVRLLVAQGAVLLVLGLVVGGALGLALSDGLGRQVLGQGTRVRPLAFLVSFGACAAMAAAALVLPARRAAAVEPAAVLREE